MDTPARRHAEEPKEDQRAEYERDRDRVLYSAAFRRLAGVTQVVGPYEGHVFHNRLTHTLKVAQLARRIAEKFVADASQQELISHLGGLDLDCVEAAALIHDLGHPPFGHIAETELDRLSRDAGAADGFEGNAQSFRIVTKLEAHSASFVGLNLTRRTLNGVLKYPWRRDLSKQNPKRYRKFGSYESEEEDFQFAREGTPGARQSLEAAVMDYADAITYSVHDLDDFYRAGLIPIEQLRFSSNELDAFLDRWRRDGPYSESDLESARPRFEAVLDLLFFEERFAGSFAQRAVFRTATSSFIRDFVYAAKLQEADAAGQILSVDPERMLEMKFLQRMVWDYVIANPRLASQQEGQKVVVQSLFDAYLTAAHDRNSALIPPEHGHQLEELDSGPRGAKWSEIRLAVDIVATMADAQAYATYRRLKGIQPGSVMDLLYS